MLQKRYEVQNFVIKQLHKIPHTVIRKEDITAERIREILKNQLEFEELRHWLKNKKNRLMLSKFHIGCKMDLLILYFILEYENDEKKCIFENRKIFDKEAEQVYLKLIEDSNIINIQEMCLEEFVELFREKWKKR